jgi:hypothetical protein
MKLKEIEEAYVKESRIIQTHQKSINSIKKTLTEIYEKDILDCKLKHDIDTLWEEIKRGLPKSHILIGDLYWNHRRDITKNYKEVKMAIMPDKEKGSPAWGYELKKPLSILVEDEIPTKPGWAYHSLWRNIHYLDQEALDNFNYYINDLKECGWRKSSVDSYKRTYRKIKYPQQEVIDIYFEQNKI